MYLSFLFQVYKALFAMLSGRNFLVLCDIDTGTTHFSQVISHAKILYKACGYIQYRNAYKKRKTKEC